MYNNANNVKGNFMSNAFLLRLPKCLFNYTEFLRVSSYFIVKTYLFQTTFSPTIFILAKLTLNLNITLLKYNFSASSQQIHFTRISCCFRHL